MIIKIIVACCCLFFLFFPTCSHGADLSISSAKNTPACIRSAVHRIGRDVTRIRARDINCQNPGVVDSLEAVLQQNLAWRDQYHLLHKLAAEYFDTDNQKAFDFALEAEQAALASGDSLLIVGAA